jgi:hypothetical protein
MSTTARDVSHHPSLSDFQRVWGEPRGLIGYLRTINNIPIARRYMITAFAFFLAGGVQALLMRIQLGTPENTFLDAETYNQLFTMHGTTMMFLFVIPFIEAIANYLLPLLLGTRDLPFPRLTALSYWTYLFGGLFLYASFVVDAAPDAGWFAYVPLSGKPYSPGLNMDFWDIGLSVAEVSAVGAAAELIVGILRMRAPGMTLGRMPLFAWAMLVAAFMMILAFTPLIVATAMLEQGDHALLHRRPRRRSAPLAASLLDLRTSRGLHHADPGGGYRLARGADLLAASHRRISGDGDLHRRHRRDQLRALGASHVRHRHVGGGHQLLHHRQHAHRPAERRAGLRLDRDDVARRGVEDADALRRRLRRHLRPRRDHRGDGGVGPLRRAGA